MEKPYTVSDMEFYHREPKVMEFNMDNTNKRSSTDKNKTKKANAKNKNTNKTNAKTRKTPMNPSPESDKSIDLGTTPDSNNDEETTIEGCESNGRTPQRCKTKRDYYDQARIFHPDKNPGCKEDAETKFKQLAITPGCSKFVN